MRCAPLIIGIAVALALRAAFESQRAAGVNRLTQ